MITWKEAVRIAREAAADVLQTQDLTLEEIEREDYKGRNVWSITLGVPRGARLGISASAFGIREYKRFLIDSESGDFIAMQLRPVATV